MKDQIIKEDVDQIGRSIDLEAFRGKSVLVSGGSGFLGSWICDVLSEVGSRIICLDNLSTGVFENIGHLKGTKGFEFEKADVCTYSGKPKVDMVFHLASRPAPEDYQKHPVETALANATGTDKMLDLARKNDARVFYASSSEVYGDPEVFPTPESYEGKVDPLGPRSCYEEGKRFGEALCKAYHDQYDLDVRIGRLFNSYGPRLRAEASTVGSCPVSSSRLSRERMLLSSATGPRRGRFVMCQIPLQGFSFSVAERAWPGRPSTLDAGMKRE